MRRYALLVGLMMIVIACGSGGNSGAPLEVVDTAAQTGGAANLATTTTSSIPDPFPSSAVVAEVLDRLGVGPSDTSAAIRMLCEEHAPLPGTTPHESPDAENQSPPGRVLLAAQGIDHQIDSFDAELPGDPSGWARLVDGVCKTQVDPYRDGKRLNTGCDLMAGDAGNWFPYMVQHLEWSDAPDSLSGSDLDLAFWLGHLHPWPATEYESISAVACFSSSYVTPPVETCQWGGWIEHYVPVRVDVEVLEAATGRTLGQSTFEVSSIEPCPDRKVVPAAGGQVVVHYPPDPEEILSFLETIIGSREPY